MAANYKSTSPWSSTPSPNPELERRHLLAEARHFWLEGPDGEVISTLRLMEQHAGGVEVFTIGRVCTKKSTRGHGRTNRPLQDALADVRESVPVNVQTYQEEMCGSHGVIRDGAESSTTESGTHLWSSRDVAGLSVQRHRRP